MKESDYSVFISYASPDRDRVLPYFDWLDKKGFNTWMDCRRLKPGQNWDFEIKRALDKATFVLIFISKLSYDRRGYIQREIKAALDKLTEKLIDDIYIVPVLLDDDAKIPEQLSKIQYISANDSQCLELIADALQHQLESLGIERLEIQEKERVYWNSRIKKEEWNGFQDTRLNYNFLNLDQTFFLMLKKSESILKVSFFCLFSCTANLNSFNHLNFITTVKMLLGELTHMMHIATI